MGNKLNGLLQDVEDIEVLLCVDTSEQTGILHKGKCGFCGKENKLLYPLCNSDPYCRDCVKIVFNDCKNGLEVFKKHSNKRKK